MAHWLMEKKADRGRRGGFVVCDTVQDGGLGQYGVKGIWVLCGG